MQKKAVILLSGGLDSITAGAIAKEDGFELYAMSFSYGQRHIVELEAAKCVAEFLSVKEHRIIDIDLATFGGSSLTSGQDVPKNRSEISKGEIPSTYVPARNTIFLSYALAWAEVLNITDIFLGVNAVDYSGYPDCRPEFIKAYEKMANLATRAGVNGIHLNINAPLIDMSKSEIIKKGISLGVDYSLTHSCYAPDEEGLACGECDSCKLRHSGFLEASVDDPTVYSRKNIFHKYVQHITKEGEV